MSAMQARKVSLPGLNSCKHLSQPGSTVCIARDMPACPWQGIQTMSQCWQHVPATYG